MKAYAIVIKGNEISTKGYKNLIRSSYDFENNFEIQKFDAVTPDKVKSLMVELNVVWNWPHTGSEYDRTTKIRKVGYGGKDPLKRMACGLSHYMLWSKCAEINEPILVFEHDAIFNKHLNTKHLIESKFQIIGLNNPFGATRLPKKFDKIVKESNEEILPVPEIDKLEIAQGIAGNSAYMIKPAAAKKLLELVKEYGMWNNDAIMCKQLMPDMIGVTKTYYTQVQGLSSTTME